MQKLLNGWVVRSVLSGVLAFSAICYFNFWASWICYVPLFLCINKAHPKQTIKFAIVYGLSFSCLAYGWMIPGALKFTGYNLLYGIGVFIFSSMFYILFCGLIFYCLAFVNKNKPTLNSIIFQSILTGCIFCIAEALLVYLSTGMPWFSIQTGSALADNIYAIQIISFFGIHLLTFIIVSVNYLIAFFIQKKMWLKLYIPICIIILHLMIGSILLNNFSNKPSTTVPFSVAILTENIMPDIKWNEENGNMLVKRILTLNKIATTLKPKLALWSESAIPWTYSKDDDILKEIFKITDTANITHLLGINTAYKENIIFNSAYSITPGGNVQGRYDKQYLLSFIEKPLNGWLMPFYSSNGYYAINNISNNKPLQTPVGKAGVLICNEAAIPDAAAKQVKQGAQFLVNMSNDGWFNNTYIMNLHFNYAKLRAVETRKDIIINCNNGFSGLVKASGLVVVKQNSTEPFVKLVYVQPNISSTLSITYPLAFIYMCFIFIVLSSFYHFKK